MNRSSMVGERGKTRARVEDVLDDSQLRQVTERVLGAQAEWRLVGADIAPATDGIAGFLGDHFRLSLRVKVGSRINKIALFVKSLPLANAPKANFIVNGNFNRREMVMFKLMEEMETDDTHPWSTKAFLYTDSVLVMPDLAEEGCVTRSQLDTLDLPHCLLVAASIARFHAAIANYETGRSLALGRAYTVMQDYGDIIVESNFKDTPWMRAAAKLSANYIDVFSEKYRNTIPHLKTKLNRLFLEACDDLTEREDTLNVLIHKDLWINNIMFKYKDGVPTSALLIDFQCLRYGPPAFDVMVFWYLTTSRSFREAHENTVLRHYFTTFTESIDCNTRLRLKDLGYDYDEFLLWKELSRKFGLLMAITIFPYTLLDPAAAQATFNDPETFEHYTHEDRTVPVLAHARRSEPYRLRQLEVAEEFLERYVLNKRD